MNVDYNQPIYKKTKCIVRFTEFRSSSPISKRTSKLQFFNIFYFIVKILFNAIVKIDCR